MTDAERQRAHAGDRMVLTIGDINELFAAPAVDPFAVSDAAVRGQAGIEYLHARLNRPWPAHVEVGELVLKLPAHNLPDEPGALRGLAGQTQVALQRYCDERMAANRLERTVALSASLRQMGMAVILLLASILYGVALANEWLTILPPFLRGVLFILLLLAASLAIWDALDALLFQWAPFSVSNRAYAALAAAAITIEPSTLLAAEQ